MWTDAPSVCRLPVKPVPPDRSATSASRCPHAVSPRSSKTSATCRSSPHVILRQQASTGFPRSCFVIVGIHRNGIEEPHRRVHAIAANASTWQRPRNPPRQSQRGRIALVTAVHGIQRCRPFARLPTATSGRVRAHHQSSARPSSILDAHEYWRPFEYRRVAGSPPSSVSRNATPASRPDASDQNEIVLVLQERIWRRSRS